MFWLTKNWLSERIVDFEYKKYMALAYLKGLKDHLKKDEIYPYLSDLSVQREDLFTLRHNMEQFNAARPKDIRSLSLDPPKIKFSTRDEDDDVSRELIDIVEFAWPLFNGIFHESVEKRNELLATLDFELVGLEPLNPAEGYLFLRMKNRLRIYAFQLRLIYRALDAEPFRDIQTRYLSSEQSSIYRTSSQIKYELIKKNTALPNPATFEVYSRTDVPLFETLLPLAKLKILQYSSAVTYPPSNIGNEPLPGR